MKRAAPNHRGVFLLAGIVLVLAVVAWGAAARPRSSESTTAGFVPSAPSHVVSIESTMPHAAVTASSAKKSAASSEVASAVPGEAGMRIFKDPETGEIGQPTLENAAILARETQAQPDASNLPQIQVPNGGGWMIDTRQLEDAFVVRIDQNGNRVVSCTTDPGAFHRDAKKTAGAPAREDR